MALMHSGAARVAVIRRCCHKVEYSTPRTTLVPWKGCVVPKSFCFRWSNATTTWVAWILSVLGFLLLSSFDVDLGGMRKSLFCEGWIPTDHSVLRRSRNRIPRSTTKGHSRFRHSMVWSLASLLSGDGDDGLQHEEEKECYSKRIKDDGHSDLNLLNVPLQQQQHWGEKDYRKTSPSPSKWSTFPAMLTESFLDDGEDYRPRRRNVVVSAMESTVHSTVSSTSVISDASRMEQQRFNFSSSSWSSSLDPGRRDFPPPTSKEWWGIHRQQDFYPDPSSDLDETTTATTWHNRIVVERPRQPSKNNHRSDQNSHEFSQPQFPSTIDQIAQGAAQAIALTLTSLEDSEEPTIDKPRRSGSRTRSTSGTFDPHLLINAWAGDRYWQDRRPVRQSSDCGRIGIEVDGILQTVQNLVNGDAPTKFTTIRGVALTVAQKLANHPYLQKVKETITDDATTTDDATIASFTNKAIPVVVYFNTIKQALVASEELALLKRLECHRLGTSFSSSSFETVSILSLDQNTTLPDVLTCHQKPAWNEKADHTKSKDVVTNRRRSTNNKKKKTQQRSFWPSGHMEPSRGIILVVQPTDWNREYMPPSPSIGIVSALQRLAAQASLFAIPIVVISPRFLQLDGQCGSTSTSSGIGPSGGWDQSGYQQSSSFGGREPPNGPTPWLLRDFVPPVYSWVGEVVKLPRDNHDQRHDQDNDNCYYYYYHDSEISMVQSILHRQRAWHVFSRRRRLMPRRRRCPKEWNQASLMQNDKNGNGSRSSSSSSSSSRNSHAYYQYLASTKSSAGRPTRDICTLIWKEFAASLRDDDE